jgi:hypothetical protein
MASKGTRHALLFEAEQQRTRELKESLEQQRAYAASATVNITAIDAT